MIAAGREREALITRADVGWAGTLAARCFKQFVVEKIQTFQTKSFVFDDPNPLQLPLLFYHFAIVFPTLNILNFTAISVCSESLSLPLSCRQQIACVHGEDDGNEDEGN